LCMDGFARISAAVVVIMLLGLLWWTSNKFRSAKLGWLRFSFRAMPEPADRPQLAVRGRLQLTPTHHLHLIQSMEELVLLCTYPNGCSVVLSKSVGQLGSGAASDGRSSGLTFD
jgi:hypothetical protein